MFVAWKHQPTFFFIPYFFPSCWNLCEFLSLQCQEMKAKWSQQCITCPNSTGFLSPSIYLTVPVFHACPDSRASIQMCRRLFLWSIGVCESLLLNSRPHVKLRACGSLSIPALPTYRQLWEIITFRIALSSKWWGFPDWDIWYCSTGLGTLYSRLLRGFLSILQGWATSDFYLNSGGGFLVENIVFSSAIAAQYLDFRLVFFFPCAHPWYKTVREIFRLLNKVEIWCEGF